MKQVGALAGRSLHDLAAPEQEPQRLDMRAEASRTMMVLAVNIGGNRPADAHIAAPRQNGEDPPRRNDELQSSAQRNPRLALQDPRLAIKRKEAIQKPRLQDGLGERAVAVAAPEPPSDERTRCRRRIRWPRLLQPPRKLPRQFLH